MIDLLIRMRWWLCVRWARWWNDGVVIVGHQLRSVNYQRYERACMLLGLDPDKMRAGDQSFDVAELDDVHRTGAELVQCICSNDRWVRYVLRQSSKPIAEAIVAYIAADFFLRSVMQFKEQTRSYATMQSAAQ